MNPETYLQTNARKLDLRLFEYLFEGADAQPVLKELATYQNADGGFGNALEPDLRLPDSSALATTVAFQYLDKIKVSDNELVDKAIGYLVSSYDDLKQRWVAIPPTADKYPRAPWWNYKEVLEWADWGNPSAEILGYLLQHARKVNDPAFLERISQQAIKHLHKITEPEQHEVKCYIRLYEHADTKLQAKLYDRIAAHIKKLAKTDPKSWKGYVATPLTFIESLDSPFADLFDKQILLHEAEHIYKRVINDSHWEPTWKWGRFEKEWSKAKKEWSGKLTVENSTLLKILDSR